MVADQRLSSFVTKTLIWRIIIIVWHHFQMILGTTRQLVRQCARRVRVLIRETSYDKRLGIDTCGTEYFKDTSFGHDAHAYQPCDYERLARIIEYLDLQSKDVLFDIGCGKGRVLIYAAMHTPARTVGIELVSELAKIARQNALKVGVSERVSVLEGDAATCNVDEATVFFLANPFGAETLKKVLANIQKSLLVRPRPIRIVYRNATAREVINEVDWLVYKGEIAQTSALVWCNREYCALTFSVKQRNSGG